MAKLFFNCSTVIKQKALSDDEGFTLVEIIAVMIILGILAAVAVSKYVEIEENARQKAFNTVISEINARESLTWSDHKISGSGFVSDAKIFGDINYSIDPNFAWNSGDPTITGGTITFKETTYTLSRSPSTSQLPAIWKQK